ncbi:hypothetical protein FKW77_009263 [Venturia effusa]|uniref:Uncharacterized protein n=1 Tax=Venturia effusa TaxID=50376 RepID=A0A517L1Y9_9PEZI|nr:hypothetical protein FKW77_009263 [Venturia effusa]
MDSEQSSGGLRWLVDCPPLGFKPVTHEFGLKLRDQAQKASQIEQFNGAAAVTLATNRSIPAQ